MKRIAALMMTGAALCLASCVGDDTFMNSAMQEAQAGHLEAMRGVRFTPTPDASALAKLKAVNYTPYAP